MKRIVLYSLAAVLLPVSVLAGAGAATAQTNAGSSLGPCTVTTSTAGDFGNHNVGDSFKARLTPVCLFDSGAVVTVFVNGQSVGTKTADASGSVTVSITVKSATQLSIDDPVLVNGQCGANSISAAGASSAAQSNVTVSGSFNVLCAATATTTKSGLAFTGGDFLGLVAFAFALVIVGAVVVQSVRRRRGARTPA
jgi:hypothetical protein